MSLEKIDDEKNREKNPDYDDEEYVSRYDRKKEREYEKEYREPKRHRRSQIHYHNEYKKLYRSTREKWLGGVCGGLAEHFNKDPILIRLLWIVVTIFSFGVGVIAYIAFWLVVDKHPGPYPSAKQYNALGKPKAVHYHYYYKTSSGNF
jgi:phage shock protein PspC (stress-responsive transcriptional regulator)